MTLENIYYIGQTLAVVAVIASLLFVGFQVRQNTKHARAQIQSARVDRLMTQMVGFSDTDKCAAYIRGNGGEPTPEAIMERQFYLQCVAQSGVILDVLTQHRDGLLSDEQFNLVTATYRRWLKQPGFREMMTEWMTSNAGHAPEYSAFIKDLMNEQAQS
ncbi:MAG: hypothetical protein R3C58_06875 [Parvularculaceae bacterium]